jgi:hypothetical protein
LISEPCGIEFLKEVLMKSKSFSSVEDLVASMDGYKIVKYQKDWEYWNNVWIPIIQAPDGFEFPFAILKFKFNSAVLVRNFALTPKMLEKVEDFYRKTEDPYSDYSVSDFAFIYRNGKVINILTKKQLSFLTKNKKKK